MTNESEEAKQILSELCRDLQSLVEENTDIKVKSWVSIAVENESILATFIGSDKQQYIIYNQQNDKKFKIGALP